MRAVKRSALERLYETVPGVFTVDKATHGRSGGSVSVKDAVGTEVVNVSVSSSNSGDTCGIGAHRMLYISEWDEAKVASKVLYCFYARACSKPATSLEAAALRELRRAMSAPGAPALPPAVAAAVRAVHELYLATRGEDAVRAWEEMRKVMAKLVRKGASEDDLLREWREILVREVQES